MKPPRPGSATAFGVLNIVLGCLLLVCGLVAQAKWTVTSNGRDVTQEKDDFLSREVSGYATYRVADPIVVLALGVGFIVSAIGLLMVKAWGRFFSLVVAALAVLYYIGDTAYQIFLVNPGVKKFTDQMTGFIPAGGIVGSFRTSTIVTWALIVIAYSLVLFVLLLGGRTARAFRGEYDPDEDWDDRPRRRRRDLDDEYDDDEDDRPRRRGRRRDDDRVQRRDDDEDRVRRRDDDDEDRPRRRPSRHDDDD